jgi:hypothetical protein
MKGILILSRTIFRLRERRRRRGRKTNYRAFQEFALHLSTLSYDPQRLDHAIRWISINPDFRAAGILLPATSETEGFLKEEAKGNIKYLDQGESVDFIYNAGILTGSELQSLIGKLN